MSVKDHKHYNSSKNIARDIEEVKKTRMYVERKDGTNISGIIIPHDAQIGLGDDNFRSDLGVKGDLKVDGTIKGSIQSLSDGNSYLVAGSNVTITSASNGQVTISSSGGGGGGSGAVSSVANGADNRIATFSSADALNGEANLTFDGTTLEVAGTLGVNANTSGNFAVIIDNDENSSGHGLKVTSDGTGSGTKLLDIEAGSTTVMRVRGDGRVGVGKVTALPSARLTVDANGLDADIAIAQKIQHIGDDDTHIEFGVNSVTVTAGNINMLSLEEAGADRARVLILSGGAASSFDEASSSDVGFYVSGSSNTRGTSTRGTSVVGGDLAISGSLWQLSKPGFVICDCHFYLGSAPSPEADLHLEWNDGGVQNLNPEAANNNQFWKYFPYGGEILSVFATGGDVSNSSTDNPFQETMVFAMYDWTSEFAQITTGGSNNPPPIGHMTASAGDLFVDNTGAGSYLHRSTYDFTNSTVTGSMIIPAGRRICIAVKGRNAGNTKGFEKLNISVTYKLGLK